MNVTKNVLTLQSVLLSAGTVVAWNAVYVDFSLFYQTYGTIFKITHCTTPNPIITPCFYGAIAFLVALVWSLRMVNKMGVDLFQNQKRLVYLLIASTLFGWANFAHMLYGYYTATPSAFSCVVAPGTNPLHTPCFFGSVFFLASLITAVIALVQLKKQQVSST
jgi:hypothetical protein